MAKVIHQRDKCIGCGTCVAVCADFWEMGQDGKASLKGAKDNVLEIQDPGCNKEAVSACPIQIITIEE